MSFRERLTDRLLAILGIDLDVTLAVQRKPISEITSTLFVGSRPAKTDMDSLKTTGITHVVSCLAPELSDEMSFLADDFQHLFLPLRDSIDEDIFSLFSTVFDFADSAAKEQTRAKLLIHCEAGVSRSATLAIALLMKAENRNFIDAYQQTRAGRPEVLPNIGFASHLQRLERDLCPELISVDGASSLAKYLCQYCNVPTDIEMLESTLERYGHDSVLTIRAIFGGEIPRMIQGVRV